MQITANIYTTKTVLQHPWALGPHLFMPIACSNARIILQRNFIWRHLLTLTVHKVQFHTSRLPNRRTEQWEQTHCLIRAEVSALKRWNAKAKSPPPAPLNLLYLTPVLPLSPFSAFSLHTLPSRLKNGVTFTTLMEKKVLSALVSKCREISESLSK